MVLFLPPTTSVSQASDRPVSREQVANLEVHVSASVSHPVVATNDLCHHPPWAPSPFPPQIKDVLWSLELEPQLAFRSGSMTLNRALGVDDP